MLQNLRCELAGLRLLHQESDVQITLRILAIEKRHPLAFHSSLVSIEDYLAVFRGDLERAAVQKLDGFLESKKGLLKRNFEVHQQVCPVSRELMVRLEAYFYSEVPGVRFWVLVSLSLEQQLPVLWKTR